ncbi:hypothetical protein QWZ08_19355 [Ferruginibacter paludis]|uniref:hypothetical protein n=1 Tax=Ferruginibacter paludis TaxID=1310417 RepID=UPI0025B41E04|nr:hypothetical protein [Ferruginibacter paludis]MDN3657818.1 hypothetical protein [Ferruginibacter paludis]
MKKRIERCLYWFKDGRENLNNLDDLYFGLSVLLTTLLNEKYDGVKIKFINIDLATEDTYRIVPALEKFKIFYQPGHLRYYGVLDIDSFLKMSGFERKKYLWDEAHNFLRKASKVIGNPQLGDACEYCYAKGISINLNTDYKVIETELNLYDKVVQATLLIQFDDAGMYSKLILRQGNSIFYEKTIDKARNGIEFFLEMYKSVESDGKSIVIKGAKDVDYLPLKIAIDKF